MPSSSERLQRFMSISTEETPNQTPCLHTIRRKISKQYKTKNVIVCSGASVGLPGGEIIIFRPKYIKVTIVASTVFLN